jgi:hypothetical protein
LLYGSVVRIKCVRSVSLLHMADMCAGESIK